MLFKQKRTGNDFSYHLLIWLVLICSFFPMYMMFNISLKSNKQFFNQPWLPTFPFQWSNLDIAWEMVGQTIGVTIYICASATLITLVLATLAAYFFGRFRMPGTNFLWSAFLVLMLMPSVANLIPLFSLLRNLNLLNTLLALIIVSASGGQVFTVYVLRHFVEDIPNDLFEAAEMDGASHIHQIIHIVIPMSGSILSTLAILRFISVWNSFILPLVIIRDAEKLPLAVQLYQLEGAYVKEWGPLMGAYSIAAIPIIIIFLFSMRLFVKGLSAGAIKG